MTQRTGTLPSYRPDPTPMTLTLSPSVSFLLPLTFTRLHFLRRNLDRLRRSETSRQTSDTLPHAHNCVHLVRVLPVSPTRDVFSVPKSPIRSPSLSWPRDSEWNSHLVWDKTRPDTSPPRPSPVETGRTTETKIEVPTGPPPPQGRVCGLVCQEVFICKIYL